MLISCSGWATLLEDSACSTLFQTFSLFSHHLLVYTQLTDKRDPKEHYICIFFRSCLFLDRKNPESNKQTLCCSGNWAAVPYEAVIFFKIMWPSIISILLDSNRQCCLCPLFCVHACRCAAVIYLFPEEKPFQSCQSKWRVADFSQAKSHEFCLKEQGIL